MFRAWRFIVECFGSTGTLADASTACKLSFFNIKINITSLALIPLRKQQRPEALSPFLGYCRYVTPEERSLWLYEYLDAGVTGF
jgi:hypothetical protein